MYGQPPGGITNLLNAITAANPNGLPNVTNTGGNPSPFLQPSIVDTNFTVIQPPAGSNASPLSYTGGPGFRQPGDMGRYIAFNDPGQPGAGFSNYQEYLAAGNAPVDSGSSAVSLASVGTGSSFRPIGRPMGSSTSNVQPAYEVMRPSFDPFPPPSDYPGYGGGNFGGSGGGLMQQIPEAIQPVIRDATNSLNSGIGQLISKTMGTGSGGGFNPFRNLLL